MAYIGQAPSVFVSNSQISGNIISSQITSVANTQITGNIISSQITSVANTQITGNIISSQITSVANTQITGNIISSQITSVANTQITGNIMITQIEPAGATAGVYGSTSVIPVITVDYAGRLSFVANATPTFATTGKAIAMSMVFGG